MLTTDKSGRPVMKQREDDKSCVALDRETNLCTIYENRPTVCREFNTDSGQCIEQVSLRSKAQRDDLSDHVEMVVRATLAYAKMMGFEVDVHKPKDQQVQDVYLMPILHRTVLTEADKDRALKAFMEVMRG